MAQVTALALDTEDIITACARLVALAQTMPEEVTRDAILYSAAEFSAMFQVDSDRVKVRATEILDYARRNAAAEYN